jgi:hypothetical protein
MKAESGSPVGGRRVLQRITIFVVAGVVIVGLLVQAKIRERRRWAAELDAIEAAVEKDDLHLDLSDLDTTSWVRQYEPSESAGGYTLALYRRRVPMIIDMNSRIVHLWPNIRAVGRIRLDREGNLAVIGTDNLVKEYDWDGRLKWYYRLPIDEDFPHHDLLKLRNGNYLVLAREDATHTGYLHEVDRRGRVVWEWRSLDHIDDFPTWPHDRKDPTHINSIHELPENPWFDRGDDRFRPGNILLSARHLNTIFIVDKRSGDVVWQYSDGLDYQHEATMIGKDEPGAGRILVFNNGRHNSHGYRRTLVQAIDPTTGVVEWEYGSRFFFSSIAGTVQKLPGRNYAVNSSHGGRVFEITPAGKIVWEWVPSYMPMRVERLPYDHCPQLAAVGPPEEIEVQLQGDTRPYVDIDLYRFALSEEFVTRTLAGHSRRLLESDNECRELLIPPRPTMWTEFGIDEERLQGRWIEARFQLTVDDGEGPTETVLDVSLNTESESPWRGRNVRLGRFTYKWVTMCVSTEVQGEMENPLEMVAWGNPLIRSLAQHPEVERSEEKISEQERKLREQQLKALGYVN